MNGAAVDVERASREAEGHVPEDRWSFWRGVLLGVLLGVPAWVLVVLALDALS